MADDMLDLEAGGGLPAFVQDPAGIVRMRWPWMAAALLFGLVATVVFVGLFLTPRYEAAATVLVASQRVAENFVRTTVDSDPFEKINAMVGEALSTDNLIRMIEGLDRFVELDIPFLLEERVERVANLKILMERADVTVAEKFRRLTEAFQIENDFGRTIEAYQGTLVIEGATLEVSFLRLGRIGLYYQTADAGATGRWDPEARDWEVLGGSKARNQVRRGLKMARKQVAPDLLLLPVVFILRRANASA